MNFDQFKEVMRQTFDEWSKDYIPREAGALAFFTVFPSRQQWLLRWH